MHEPGAFEHAPGGLVDAHDLGFDAVHPVPAEEPFDEFVYGRDGQPAPVDGRVEPPLMLPLAAITAAVAAASSCAARSDGGK